MQGGFHGMDGGIKIAGAAGIRIATNIIHGDESDHFERGGDGEREGQPFLFSNVQQWQNSARQRSI